jgi:hypothetical protein
MNKLIKLLNEYEKISPSRLQRKYYSENWHIMYIDEEWEDVDDYRTDYEIISKEYGFIKWLVDNDKINFIKVIQKKWHWEIDNIMLSMKEREYLELLMLLAIQENSIEFLISILK